MSENTRDWHVTLTTRAYLEYTVEADDEESAIEMATYQYENEGDGFYEPLDLKISACRLVLAGRGQVENGSRRLRIATKYPTVTRHYFAGKGVQIEVVKLYGSMELAPLVGLADYIVDLVDTGNTLKANGLVTMEHIVDITSRLIVNKASMKIKHAQITDLIDRFSAIVG